MPVTTGNHNREKNHEIVNLEPMQTNMQYGANGVVQSCNIIVCSASRLKHSGFILPLFLVDTFFLLPTYIPQCNMILRKDKLYV